MSAVLVQAASGGADRVDKMFEWKEQRDSVRPIAQRTERSED